MWRGDAVDDSNNATKIKQLENSIAEKEKRIYSLNEQILDYYDSLKVSKEAYAELQKVKNKVRVKYKTVYVDLAHYSNNQLDSVIRSNW